MSDKPDKESQTEEPTEKRLSDSVERGDTPNSREVTTFAGLFAAVLFFYFFLRSGARPMVAAMQNMLDQSGQYQIGAGRNALHLIDATMRAVGQFLLPAIVLIIVMALVATFGQNAPQIAPERLMPKLERIAPDWSRVISMRGVTELFKSLAKLLIVGLVAFFVIKGEIGAAIATIQSDPAGLAEHILDVSTRLLSGITLAVFVLAAFDFAWTRIHWKRDLRMSRQDVKDEMKQMQGDPMVKARQRSVALERARKRMMAAVPTATMVIANPTHYAIALRYVREEGGAPKVVAKGQDLIALKIREIAEQNDIPVIEDKALARSMYDRVEVDMMIPAEFYRVIAELIHFLNRTGASGQQQQGRSS
ncbi:flagellar biosynthesis protein FlhB [Rhodoblastus sphagnicola]|uniref:Flagellar biosynthetic protein FlhB n=1 Tax=Rhodoblastus sphagnicola TaxID=333368 RepID=A0A2S6NCN8_9HYPH|nr:flagellar biosynthesis protein FlhB [Rhodoblastus sphagnicola]MBB4199384.1 flagellar biosynthetic protein FlhB [Rhodoblastus sphagnicola]PPQ32359.1 flagellar biosynthesis protein FlhB [Rhodoblastus sphagnicola]